MIFKVHHEDQFTVVANSTIRDPRISFKATGVLVFLLSQPTEWNPNRDHLASVKSDGTGSVRTALEELSEAGYIYRERTRLSDGTVTWAHHVHETPLSVSQWLKLTSGGAIFERPVVDSPPADDPPADDALLGSNEEEELEEETRARAHGGDSLFGDARDEVVDLDRGFPLFWERYPKRNGRKIDRGKALALWRRMPIDVRRACYRATKNYAEECNAGKQTARDAWRYLRDGTWRDYEDPLPESSGLDDGVVYR